MPTLLTMVKQVLATRYQSTLDSKAGFVPDHEQVISLREVFQLTINN